MIPIVLSALLLATPGTPPSVGEGLKAIRAVGREGTGNEAAAEGWKAVVVAGSPALIPTLQAFNGANSVALNWLRLAATALPAPKDVAPLLAFVRDESGHPAARRIAFEIAKSRDSAATAALLKSRINDRDRELRREAIATRLPDANTPAELETLFRAAREVDQCELLSKKLAVAGKPVDLPSHYGLITEWQYLGPLDAPESAGFTTTYPPETAGYDPAMMLVGKGGVKLIWKPVRAKTPNGQIDFNETIGKLQNAVAFVTAEFESPAAMPVEVRLTTPDALKVYINGELALAREAYHQGTPRDQYIARGQFKAGKNRVTVKICQNDQPQPWAKQWDIIARLCDETGGALPLRQRLPNGELVPLARFPAANKEGSK